MKEQNIFLKDYGKLVQGDELDMNYEKSAFLYKISVKQG